VIGHAVFVTVVLNEIRLNMSFICGGLCPRSFVDSCGIFEVKYGLVNKLYTFKVSMSSIVEIKQAGNSTAAFS